MVELHHMVISGVSMVVGVAVTLLGPWQHFAQGVSEREAFQLGRDSMLPIDAGDVGAET